MQKHLVNELFTSRIYVAVESFGEDLVVVQIANLQSRDHHPKLSALGREMKGTPREGEGRKGGVESDEKRREALLT